MPDDAPTPAAGLCLVCGTRLHPMHAEDRRHPMCRPIDEGDADA